MISDARFGPVFGLFGRLGPHASESGRHGLPRDVLGCCWAGPVVPESGGEACGVWIICEICVGHACGQPRWRSGRDIGLAGCRRGIETLAGQLVFDAGLCGLCVISTGLRTRKSCAVVAQRQSVRLGRLQAWDRAHLGSVWEEFVFDAGSCGRSCRVIGGGGASCWIIVIGL